MANTAKEKQKEKGRKKERGVAPDHIRLNRRVHKVVNE